MHIFFSHFLGVFRFSEPQQQQQFHSANTASVYDSTLGCNVIRAAPSQPQPQPQFHSANTASVYDSTLGCNVIRAAPSQPQPQPQFHSANTASVYDLPALGIRLKHFHSDGGSELIREPVCTFLHANVITTSHTPRDTPEMNSLLERKVRDLKERVMSMLLHSTLPVSFWWMA
jgi:hypothetical protein